MGAVTARDLKTLMFDQETPETIRSALDALNGLEPASSVSAEKIIATRNDLLIELDLLTAGISSHAQQSLF